MKVTPRQGKRDTGRRILQTRAVTRVEGRQKRPSLPVHPLLQPKRPLCKLKEIMRRIAEAGQLKGGREVTFIVADLTVGPDGCRGWAIYIR